MNRTTALKSRRVRGCLGVSLLCCMGAWPVGLQYVRHIACVCRVCVLPCSTCTGSSQSQCKTCSSANFRVLSGSTCACMVGYYSDGVSPACLPCHSSCSSCTGPLSSQCSSCNALDLRLLSGTSCSCLPGYATVPPQDFATISMREPRHARVTCHADSRTWYQLGAAASVNHPWPSLCVRMGCRYYDGGSATCQVCDYTCK